MKKKIISLCIGALLLQGCGKELQSRYATHRYTECGALYEVTAQNFKNSVKSAINNSSEIMYVAGRKSAESAYPKEEANQIFKKEKEKQLKLVREIYAKEDSAALKAYGERCDELGEKLVNAVKKKN